MTLIAVGASTCASGSQVCNGNIGILMAKPMKSATHTTRAEVAAEERERLGVPVVGVGQLDACRSVWRAGVPSTSAVGAAW